jgi:hypothetical protein
MYFYNSLSRLVDFKIVLSGVSMCGRFLGCSTLRHLDQKWVGHGSFGQGSLFRSRLYNDCSETRVGGSRWVPLVCAS